MPYTVCLHCLLYFLGSEQKTTRNLAKVKSHYYLSALCNFRANNTLYVMLC